MKISDIIDKRKARWEEKHDLEFDRKLVEASVSKIIETESLRQEVIEKPYLMIEVAFYIVDKKRNTVPFFLNDVQQDFIRQLERLGTKKPYFVLKGRQQGFTSVITAIQLAFAIIRKNFSGFTMADRTDNTMAIFNDKARVVFDRLPDRLKPSAKFNSRNELFFDKLNSSWRIATATDQVGRSRTLNFVHFSEVAFYECSLADLQAGIGEAITADAIQVYETTANGFNQAKELWDSGACNNLFYEWWRSPEYRSEEYQYLDTDDGWLIERKKVLADLGCDKEQITWYCKKYDGYLDKNLIKQEYPITPEEAFIASGYSIFDMDKIANRMAAVSGKKWRTGQFRYRTVGKPIIVDGDKVGEEWIITDIRFEERADGCIQIHDEPKTKSDRDGNVISACPYVIGGDTAGSGIDYFTAKVLDNTNGHTVATLRVQHMDEDVYAEQMYCLGKYYNDALIGIEINYSIHPTRVLQTKYRYPRMFMRERLDTSSDKVELQAGFETNRNTKRVILQELVAAFRDDPSIECDMETLREMSTFVKKDNGKQEAIDGAHDDLVMALAIAHHCRGQQSYAWETKVPEPNHFIEENFHVDPEPTGNADYMSWEDL